MLQLTLGFDPNVVSPGIVSGFMLMGVKALFLLGVFTYFIFSIVIVRQIAVMRKTLITSFSPVVQLVGFAHLIAVIVFGLVFLLIL